MFVITNNLALEATPETAEPLTTRLVTNVSPYVLPWSKAALLGPVGGPENGPTTAWEFATPGGRVDLHPAERGPWEIDSQGTEPLLWLFAGVFEAPALSVRAAFMHESPIHVLEDYAAYLSAREPRRRHARRLRRDPWTRQRHIVRLDDPAALAAQHQDVIDLLEASPLSLHLRLAVRVSAHLAERQRADAVGEPVPLVADDDHLNVLAAVASLG